MVWGEESSETREEDSVWGRSLQEEAVFPSLLGTPKRSRWKINPGEYERGEGREDCCVCRNGRRRRTIGLRFG